MSLILDALRKSEAERRRGQAPSLYSHAPVPGASLRQAWLSWLPVAGGVLLLVGAAVWFLRGSGTPASKDDLLNEGSSLVTTPADADASGAATKIVLVPAPPPSAAVAPNATRGAQAAPNVDALVKAPPNAAATAIPPSVNAAPTAGTDNDADASSDTTAPAEEAVPPVAVLDPSTRGSLPPMKLSMHVYDADPSRRFAIIDGQRVTEGSQLGSAVVVEIRRDGVLIDVSGRRLLLPRP